MPVTSKNVTTIDREFPLTEEQISLAQKIVATNAQNSKDATLLLGMLGIMPTRKETNEA